MKMSIEDKKVIKRILYLFRPYIKKVVLILACMLASEGISMVIPRISQQLMDKGLLEAKNRIYLNSIIPFIFNQPQGRYFLKLHIKISRLFNNSVFDSQH